MGAIRPICNKYIVLYAAIFGASSLVLGGVSVNITQYNSGLPDSWPSSNFTGNAPVIASGENGAGAPDGGQTTEIVSANKVESETFTPTTNFNLGAFSVIPSSQPLNSSDAPSIHLFQLSSAVSGSSTGYTLSADEVGPDLLGGGNGLNFTWSAPGFSIGEFDFSGSDQVSLQAGVTYAFEIWSSASTPDFFLSRTAGTNSLGQPYLQPYLGGQVYSALPTMSPPDDTQAFSDVERGLVGGGPRNLLFAIYSAPVPEPASGALFGLGCISIFRARPRRLSSAL